MAARDPAGSFRVSLDGLRERETTCSIVKRVVVVHRGEHTSNEVFFVEHVESSTDNFY